MRPDECAKLVYPHRGNQAELDCSQPLTRTTFWQTQKVIIIWGLLFFKKKKNKQTGASGCLFQLLNCSLIMYVCISFITPAEQEVNFFFLLNVSVTVVVTQHSAWEVIHTKRTVMVSSSHCHLFSHWPNKLWPAFLSSGSEQFYMCLLPCHEVSTLGQQCVSHCSGC